MDKLCYRCRHQTGPLTCSETALGLTPGWPRCGGVLVCNAPPGEHECPRFSAAPPWADYAGDLSDLGLRIEAERVTGGSK
jgi:hypothetical protein